MMFLEICVVAVLFSIPLHKLFGVVLRFFESGARALDEQIRAPTCVAVFNHMFIGAARRKARLWLLAPLLRLGGRGGLGEVTAALAKLKRVPLTASARVAFLHLGHRCGGGLAEFIVDHKARRTTHWTPAFSHSYLARFSVGAGVGVWMLEIGINPAFWQARGIALRVGHFV